MGSPGNLVILGDQRAPISRGCTFTNPLETRIYSLEINIIKYFNCRSKYSVSDSYSRYLRLAFYDQTIYQNIRFLSATVYVTDWHFFKIHGFFQLQLVTKNEFYDQFFLTVLLSQIDFLGLLGNLSR